MDAGILEKKAGITGGLYSREKDSMEAFFQVRTEFRGTALDMRFYRSINKLLSAIEGNWISPRSNDSSYEVKLFTDHEAWDKDFSPADFGKTIDEAVQAFNSIEVHAYAPDGKTIVGEHPDYQRLCKEWRTEFRAKLQKVVRGAVK